MKRFFRALCVLLTASALASSCLNDSDDNATLTYSDTAITAVTLGTLNRYTRVASATSATGDTLIKTTLTGSLYKMSIDQLNHRIYNETQLPVGTDVKHVVFSTLSTKNNGVVALMSMQSDSLQWFSTNDSVDFTQPRTFRVYSTDGTGWRDYTVALETSPTTGITFGWQKVADRADLLGWNDKHLVAFADSVLLTDIGTIVVRSGSAGDCLMRVGAGGVVERSWSAAADSWQAVGDGDGGALSQLVGATDHEIYALGTDHRMKVSADWGKTWRDEALDDDQRLLPAEGSVACVAWPYAPSDSTDYVLLVGKSQLEEDAMVVWRKISNYAGTDGTGRWVYMPVDKGENRYALPRQDGLSLAYYDGAVLAVGSGLTCLQSRDQGITWRPNVAYDLPGGLEGTLVSMATDSKGRLWLVTNAGQIWEGAKR